MKEIQKQLLNNPWRFLPHTLAEYLSDGMWVPYRYLKFISDFITDAIAKGNGRIIISLPPRMGKSLLISHWVPVWFFENWPDQNIILTSYEADFAANWGRKVRNTIQENKDDLTVRLSPDSTSASRWNTTRGGGMLTAGAGGPITGRGGNLIIVDDPHKNWQEAQSETVRQRIIDWFNSTLYTRCEPGATIIIVQTRWHQEDLSGYLLKNHSDRWQEIRLPAIAEIHESISPYWEREVDEPLCPERYSKEDLLEIKLNIGNIMWAALYQQRPAPMEGSIFKIEWWKYYNDAPAFDLIIQSWDTAFKTTENASYTVCQTWGRAQDGYYLIDQYRGRVEYPELKKLVQTLAEKYDPHRILVEDRASGQSIVQDLRRTTRLPIFAVPLPKGEDKVIRASLVSALVESGESSCLKTVHGSMTSLMNSPISPVQHMMIRWIRLLRR